MAAVRRHGFQRPVVDRQEVLAGEAGDFARIECREHPRLGFVERALLGQHAGERPPADVGQPLRLSDAGTYDRTIRDRAVGRYTR